MTGKLNRVVRGSRYGLHDPAALAVTNGVLWVANVLSNSVTEVNASTGAFVTRLAGRTYGFRDPAGIALFSELSLTARSCVAGS